MKNEPTVNFGFVMMHGPENEHLKKECAGLYVSIICQRSVKDEGLHNGDYWRPNGQFGIKVPADADGIEGAQNPMRHTPWHELEKVSAPSSAT